MKKVLALMLILVMCLSNIVYAWPGDHGGWEHRRDYRYHDRGWWVGGALVTGLAIGTVIASIPPHRVVYIEGIPYYYDGTYYYHEYPDGGYVVVEPPVVVATPQPVVVQQVVIPRDFESVQWRGTTYYTKDGHWYVVTTSGLVEIANPIH